MLDKYKPNIQIFAIFVWFGFRYLLFVATQLYMYVYYVHIYIEYTQKYIIYVYSEIDKTQDEI